MLARLYTSVALFVLPSVDDVLKAVASAAAKLDARTVHLERQLEDKAVALAKNAHQHRSVIDRFMAAVDGLIEALEAAFRRREQRIIDEVNGLRSKLDAASSARYKVAALLGD